MTMKEMAFAIENLQNRAEIIHSQQNALYAAIYRQDEFSYKNYDWAFVALGEMTKELEDKLKELTTAVFDYLRKEQEDADRTGSKGQAV